MTSLLDPDILAPDNPDQLQPDHDESLAPWLAPEADEAIWLPSDQAVTYKSFAPRALMGASVTGAPDVRFSREIRQGMHGKDVIAHKRALSRARPDLYAWIPDGNGFTDLAGDYFMDAVVKYKSSHRLGHTRVLGGVAHESLERAHRKGHADQWAFDARAIELAKEYYDETHISPETRIRNAIVQAGFFWYAHRFAIAYSQYRPFELGRPPFVPHRWDCSAFVTNCHYAGGGLNPNGRPWDHLGYTGTLMSRGTKVRSVLDLKLGDLIFYGSTRSTTMAFPAGSPTHVAMYVGTFNGAHMVLSMGSYPMKFVTYSYRHDVNHFRHYSVV